MYGPISHHIMPLVINSLEGGHIHMDMHTYIQTQPHTHVYQHPTQKPF